MISERLVGGGVHFEFTTRKLENHALLICCQFYNVNSIFAIEDPSRSTHHCLR